MKHRPVWLAGAGILVALALLVLWHPWLERLKADPDDIGLVVQGEALYAERCASCHGERLEGQPNWRRRLPSGRLPAPPHDPSGHTWHHPDDILFGMVKHGLGPYAPAGYQSDMPAFEGILTDQQIWAVLAFIKSEWPL